MAQKVSVALEDDLDGSPAAETVRFGLGGAEYEIDLSKKNARAFRKGLSQFVEHARKAGRVQSRRAASTGQPAAQRRHPGLGESAGNCAERARPHPGQRGPAIRSLPQRALKPDGAVT